MRFSHVLLLIVILSLLLFRTKSQADDSATDVNNEDDLSGLDLGENDNDDIDDSLFDNDDYDDYEDDEIEDVDFEDDFDDEDFDDEDEEYEDDDEDEGLYSSTDIEPFYRFLDIEEHNLPIGKDVDILFGFNNNGEQSFKVYYVFGYIVNPNNWMNYFQNFTRLRYNATIAPYQTASLKYNFMPHPQFDSRMVGLKIDVLYQSLDTNLTYLTTFFNDTVFLQDTRTIDSKTIFLTITLLGLFGLVGFYIYVKYFQGKVSRTRKEESKDKGKKGGKKGSDEDDDEDIDLDYLSPQMRKKVLAEREKKKQKMQ